MLNAVSHDRLGLLALALALATGPVVATDVPVQAPADETAPPSAESLAGEVDALHRQIQGMAGKLKESAAARKGAEQARMEAERRLAEVVQDNHALNAELGLLRDAKLAMEVARDRAQEREAKASAAFAQVRGALASLGAECDAAQQRIAVMEGERARIQAELDAERSRARRLRVELKAAANARDSLTQRLDAMRSMVPAADGGSLTLDEARARAADAAAALRKALASAAGSVRAQGLRDLHEAEQELHRRQFEVAWVSGARSVYRVRSRDTLALVARRIYGDSGRWRDISEANRHVLPDPDRLMPSMTLVVP